MIDNLIILGVVAVVLFSSFMVIIDIVDKYRSGKDEEDDGQ